MFLHVFKFIIFFINHLSPPKNARPCPTLISHLEWDTEASGKLQHPPDVADIVHGVEAVEEREEHLEKVPVEELAGPRQLLLIQDQGIVTCRAKLMSLLRAWPNIICRILSPVFLCVIIRAVRAIFFDQFLCCICGIFSFTLVQ